MNDWIYEWMTVYGTSLWSALYLWTYCSHSSISKGLLFTLFKGTFFFKQRILFYLNTWQMSHTSAIMKFSLYCQVSVPDEESMLKLFILFPLDYCNGLLAGVPVHIISRLHLVWNVAARIQSNTGSNKYVTLLFVSSKLEMKNYY